MANIISFLQKTKFSLIFLTLSTISSSYQQPVNYLEIVSYLY